MTDVKENKLLAYELLTEEETAKLLKMSKSRLQKDRVKCQGLKYLKLSRSIRYRMSDILEYLEANLHQQTSAKA